jgi:hypothetical protein
LIGTATSRLQASASRKLRYIEADACDGLQWKGKMEEGKANPSKFICVRPGLWHDGMSLSVSGAFCRKRKAGSSSDNRAHLCLMLKQLCRAICNKQTQSEPVRTGRLEAVKRFKDIFQMLWSDADSGIVNLNPNTWADPTAPDKNPTAPFRKLYRVAHEVADDAWQQNWLARDHRAGCDHTQLNASLVGDFRDIPLDRRKRWAELNRNQKQLRGFLVDVQCSDDLVHLIRNLHDGMLAESNALAVDIIRGAGQEKMVTAQYYLQVLTKVVTRHGQQHGVKISATSEVLVVLTLTGTNLRNVMHIFGSR